MSITALVDTVTGEFIDSGIAPDARYQRKAVSRNPDPRIERWDAVAGFVAKTPPEIAAYDAAQGDVLAATAFDTAKALKAVALSNLAARLGKNPAALTPADISAERTRIITIYKAL